MQKITPFLWFDDQAEEAVKFYTSIFPNSRILQVTHYPPSAAKQTKRPPGSIMTIVFELDGQRFTAINGGPEFKFNAAISLMINCDSQEELDSYWEKLIADGGEAIECGWLTDKYGMYWQVVPKDLDALLKEPPRAERVMAEVLKMKKLDIGHLKAA